MLYANGQRMAITDTMAGSLRSAQPARCIRRRTHVLTLGIMKCIISDSCILPIILTQGLVE